MKLIDEMTCSPCPVLMELNGRNDELRREHMMCVCQEEQSASLVVTLLPETSSKITSDI